MSTSHIYHTQGIRNYHRVKEEYVKDAVLIHIEHHSNKYSCRQCHSKNVSIIKDRERKIQGLKSGLKQVYSSSHIICLLKSYTMLNSNNNI
jgi:hypothetical protein